MILNVKLSKLNNDDIKITKSITDKHIERIKMTGGKKYKAKYKLKPGEAIEIETKNKQKYIIYNNDEGFRIINYSEKKTDKPKFNWIEKNEILIDFD